MVMKSKKFKHLPRMKPSELIRLGLRDLAKVERSKRYVVNMGVWHQLRLDGKCAVCFGGSVIANTCNAPMDIDFYDRDILSDRDMKYLGALNLFRIGSVRLALEEFAVLRIGAYTSRYPVTSYKKNQTQFKRDMRSIAT